MHRKQRNFRFGFLASVLVAVALHAAGLALLSTVGFQRIGPAPKPQVPAPPPAAPIKLTGVEFDRTGKVETIDQTELAHRIEQGVERFEGESAERNEELLTRNTAWLEARSSREAVEAVARRVRKAAGAPERAYAPSESPPAGPFDFNSMLPWSQEHVIGDDGIERRVETWIDREGRSWKQSFRQATGPDGQIQQFQGSWLPDGRFFETRIVPSEGSEHGTTISSILERVSASPLLRSIYAEAVLPMLEARRNSSSRPEPSGTD